MFNDLVLIEDEWNGCVQDFFKAKGYEKFLSFVKTVLRSDESVELTDAQAWLLLHHITNQGVPLALRDEKNDEDANAATYVASVAGAVAGAVMAPVDLAYQGASSVGKKIIPSKNADSEDSTL